MYSTLDRPSALTVMSLLDRRSKLGSAMRCAPRDLPLGSPVSTVEALPTVSAIAQPGRNCWRIEKATRASVIIDADAYFEAGRAAMLKAKRRIMLIGWDFDARIRLGAPHLANEPETLGDFVLWLVERQPQLEVFVLRWDIGAIRTLFRGTTGVTLLRWM